MRVARLVVFVAVLSLVACSGPGAATVTPAPPTSPPPEAPGSAPAATPTGTPTPRPSATTQARRCTILPANNVWHARVDALPVHTRSAAYVSSIGRDRAVHPDFGGGLYEGAPFGFPVTTVPPGQRGVRVSFRYASESDPGPYPIPPGARVEGGPSATGDRHVILYDPTSCRLYELYAAVKGTDGSWRAGSGAVYDLRSNALRPRGWTSADAAGLPILPGLVQYGEVAAGHIDHAIRITAPRTRDAYVWPARHSASDSTDASLPAMGQRFRLKSSVDISRFPPQARVVAQALKEYGAILADNGSAWYLSGTEDNHWDNDALHALGRLTGADFEAVDASGLMVSADSGAV